MLVNCNNKGCMQASNALLDVDSMEVICQECGKPITNLAETMKRALKSFGQIVRTERKAFMLACNACKANREVVMTQDNKTICKTCHEPIEIHASFKLAMEEAGGLEKVDTSKSKPKKKKVTKKKAKK